MSNFFLKNSEPLHGHISLTGKPGEMRVMWVSGTTILSILFFWSLFNHLHLFLHFFNFCTHSSHSKSFSFFTFFSALIVCTGSTSVPVVKYGLSENSLIFTATGTSHTYTGEYHKTNCSFRFVSRHRNFTNDLISLLIIINRRHDVRLASKCDMAVLF